jgi:hypothetical protein
MQTLFTLSSVWGLITLIFAVLVIYRRSLTNKEADWIPLTGNAREDQAIEAQTIIEMKTKKLSIPIRALGTLSVVLLMVIIGLWIFHTLSTPPPM